MVSQLRLKKQGAHMGLWDLFGKEQKRKKAESHKEKGDDYFNEGSYQEAVQKYSAAVEKDPEYDKAHYALGCTYYRLGDYNNAIIFFKNALTIDSNNSRYYYELGRAYLGKRSLASAIESFFKALELAPSDHMSLFGIGNAYRENGNYERAAKYFRKALHLNPGDMDYQKALEEVSVSPGTPAKGTNEEEKPEVLYNLALDQIRKTNFPEGVELLHRVVKIKPDFAEAFYHLGISYMQLRNYKQALENYRQAVQLKPDDIGFKRALAEVERIVRLQEQAEEATMDIRRKLGEKST
jgi:tetratricopeptide (TPR) repeat protein